MKDESTVIKSNIYALREKESYTLSANGILFTSLWENKNSTHRSPRPYTVIGACLYNTLCYVKASLSWPGCGWLVSWWINNASPPTETSRQMTYSSPLLPRSSVSSVWSVQLNVRWLSERSDETSKNLRCDSQMWCVYVIDIQYFYSTIKTDLLVLQLDFTHSISPKFILVEK